VNRYGKNAIAASKLLRMVYKLTVNFFQIFRSKIKEKDKISMGYSFRSGRKVGKNK